MTDTLEFFLSHEMLLAMHVTNVYLFFLSVCGCSSTEFNHTCILAGETLNKGIDFLMSLGVNNR